MRLPIRRGATIVWGLSGEDRDDFSIDSGTGVLSFVGSVDFEAPGDADGDNGYLVTVEASDGVEVGSLAVIVTVSDVNEPPAVSGVGEIDYTENGVGVVGSYAATDPEGATIVWSLSGDDRDDFSIDSDTGVLSFVGSPDFEAPGDEDGDNEYLVTVEGSDGSETDRLEVRVTVTDAPAVSGVVELDYVENETAAVGSYTAVGTFTAVGTVTWGLSGVDRDDFGIDSGSGVLSFVGSPDFEESDR